MTVWAEDDYPGLRDWRALDHDWRGMLLVQPAGPAWFRCVPDDVRGGLPAVVVVVCWCGPLALRRIAMSGITLDSNAADDADERELLEDLTVPRSAVRIKKVGLGKSANNAEITLYDGTRYDGMAPGAVALLMNDND